MPNCVLAFYSRFCVSVDPAGDRSIILNIVNVSGAAVHFVRRPVVSCVKGMTVTHGTVKFFNATKGYGFIQPDDGGNDAFVHISAVERAGMSSLNEGQKVSYELEAQRNGKMAATNLVAQD